MSKAILSVLFFFFLSYDVNAVLSVDLTQSVRPAVPIQLGQGTSVNPQGDKITADSRSFFLNDKPWMPIVGEFHYSRYPALEWRNELLKMKTGGITVVSTYVFWIHHEEQQGKFDWAGQRSLRDFVQLCGQLDLKVIVRMGPWCHGEVRNGGLPDWVQHSGTKLRTKDPAFMAMVRPLYKEIAEQIDELLWKDGGSVIGVQLDNERNDVPYLLALKDLAKSVGVDVPLYTMTGWNRVDIPPGEILPLFGAYSVAFWYPHSNLNFRKSFFFTDIRDDGDMGTQFVNTRPYRSENMERYPYACCEIGGGMPSSYAKRIKIDPDEIASMVLVRLGCGNNMPGYYMYHGGVNPDGKTRLNEEHPNPMPVKDYDFQAPLGAFGQVREHYHLLRIQHLFIEDFGSRLARMPLYLPEQQPSGLDDVSTLRWSVRSDRNAGFVFFNNYQPVIILPAKDDVQFELETTSGPMIFPQKPISIPAGTYGFFPFHMDCDGIILEYATAQPLCRFESDEGEILYFFTALEGIIPELVFRAENAIIETKAAKFEEASDMIRIYDVITGTVPVVNFTNSKQAKTKFIVLNPQQDRRLWRMPFAGKSRLILSDAAIVPDGEFLCLQADDPGAMNPAVFPSPGQIKVGTKTITGSQDGIFTRYPLQSLCQSIEINVKAFKEKDAGPKAYELKGNDESTWEDAAVWKLDIPADAAKRKILLRINYTADAARLYVGDRLFDDNYFNGDPFEIGLWRIPLSDWPAIRLKVLPYSDGLMKRLPAKIKEKILQAQEAGTINTITITASERSELRISPSRN